METIIKSQEELNNITNESGDVIVDSNLVLIGSYEIKGALFVAGYTVLGTNTVIEGDFVSIGYIKAFGDITVRGDLVSREGYLSCSGGVYVRNKLNVRGCKLVFGKEKLVFSMYTNDKKVCVSEEFSSINGVQRYTQNLAISTNPFDRDVYGMYETMKEEESC